MSSRTSTETKREVTRRGDVIIVKEVVKTTSYVPGKEPLVEEVSRVYECKGVEDRKKLPEDIRRQLEGAFDRKGGETSKVATQEGFAEDFLSEHNKYRKIHGVEPLQLSEELMQVSQRRAQELADADEMKSRSDHSYGENLSCLWSSDPDHLVQVADVVSRWYTEAKNYNYGEEPRDLKSGHFTQMVWARSRELGVAAAKSPSNRIYVVASYSPPGNYVGQFKDNVRPPGSSNKPPKTFMGINLGFLKTKPQKNSTDDSTSDSNMSELNKECLACHNEYRSKHGVTPLRYSQQLARYAQEWAEELAKRDKLEHRKESKFGENLYCFKSSNPRVVATATEACKSWYDEMHHYDFDSEPRSLAAGHFTQMVWKGTSEVGMGFAKSRSGLQIIVANYNPPGNYIGLFRSNVPRRL